MSNVLRRAVGILLAVAVVVSARSAPALADAPRAGNSQPRESVFYEMNAVLSNALMRLEEMKVELALLSDIAAFPCYLEGRVVAGVLELHGNVPDESVRQRALELARRSTFLKVTDALQIRTNVSVRPPLRPARVLQQEAAELLQKNLGEPAKRLSLGVRTNGVIVLAGSIDSVESKLEISRLFRRLPGCFGVVNGLTVQRVARDGQHVVLVTRDGSMVVPSSALELESVQSAVPPLAVSQSKPPVSAPSPVAFVPPPPPQSSANEASPASRQATVPASSPLPLASAMPLPAKSLEAQKDELRLPSAVPPKPAPERIGCVPYTPSETKLPVKWTSPAPNWESQAKKLEPVNAPPASPVPPPTREQAASPTWSSPAAHPAETKWTRGVAAKSGSSATSISSQPKVAEPQPPPASAMTWHRPDPSEESEIKTNTMPVRKEMPLNLPQSTKLASAVSPAPPALSSSRRWPPAYAASLPPSKGKPGLIVFDDDPAPATATPPAIVPDKLQRQVKSVCGRQARAVTIETQTDGIVLVRVKVPNLSTEDHLSRKILAIPEMTSPQVRLVMDVAP